MNDELNKGEKLMYFKDGMLDENPAYLFEKSIKAYTEGDKEEAKKLMEKIKDNLDFLVEKYLKGEEMSSLSLSKRMLVNTVVKILIEMDCKECFFNLMKRIYNSLEISLAVSRNMNEEKIIEWMKEALKGELKTEALHVIKDIKEEEQRMFIEEIVEIAKEEVETPQYIALDILSAFPEREDVKELFINFVNDWDKTVRRISIMALSRFHNEERVREALEECYEDERDESIKFVIKTILDKNIKKEGEGNDEE